MTKSVMDFSGIMLPAENIDLSKFATVACDQFTSDAEYWKKLDEYVADSPSALRITYPEIFLNDDRQRRIEAVSSTMQAYLDGGVFSNRQYAAVLTQRKTPFSAVRRGLVAAIDLQQYDFDSKPSLIRATEGTVKERIPPRVSIRENCPLELPHVMLLCEDEDGLLVESAFKDKKEKIYDFELNMGGGHLCGYNVGDVSKIEAAVQELSDKSAKKYGSPFLFAVGDGNHSLAAAKTVYLQSTNERARYALCEIVNVYDEGITFHAIHRLVKVKDTADFIKYIRCATSGLPKKSRMFCDGQTFDYNLPQGSVEGVAVLQQLIDDYGDKSDVDYIHGLKELQTFSRQGSVGIELMPMNKSELFGYVAAHGALPRKTFSMGEGQEKRYYLEARKIR